VDIDWTLLARTRPSGGILGTRCWTFGSRKRRKIYWPGERL